MNKTTKKSIVAIALASVLVVSLSGCNIDAPKMSPIILPSKIPDTPLASAIVSESIEMLTGETETNSETKETESGATASEPELILTAYEETIATTTETETGGSNATTTEVEAVEAEAKVEDDDTELSLVPACSFPIPDGMDFSKVTVNGVEVDISDITLGDFLEQTGLERNPVGTTSLSSKYNFESGMYGIPSEEAIAEYGYAFMDGTQLSIEVVDENGNIVYYQDVDDETLNKATVKGLHISEFWVGENYEVVFCNGIKPYMPKDEFITLMGEGEQLGQNRAYSNDDFTLIVEMGVEEGEWIVDEVTLFKN